MARCGLILLLFLWLHSFSFESSSSWSTFLMSDWVRSMLPFLTNYSKHCLNTLVDTWLSFFLSSVGELNDVLLWFISPNSKFSKLSIDFDVTCLWYLKKLRFSLLLIWLRFVSILLSTFLVYTFLHVYVLMVFTL